VVEIDLVLEKTVMISVKENLELLGTRVQDCVTGLIGIVTSVTFDLYGGVLVLVNPGEDDNGKSRDSQWFEVKRLIMVDNDPIMEPPEFEWGAE
jgi:hypothetical protein